MKLVKLTIRRYQEAKAVEIQVSKTVTLALLDEKKESEGTLFFSKGKMRLEIKKPEESLIIMGKGAIWVVTPTPPEFGGKTQVMKIRSKELSRQAKAPLAALLGKPKAWDEMNIKKEIATDDNVKFSMVPKMGANFGDIVAVNVEVSPTKKILRGLSFKDELDNETTYKFNSTNFEAKVSDKSFEYVPPQDAEVTEY